MTGDAVVTVEGKRSEIALITYDEVNTAVGADVCHYKGMWITPEHPILWHGATNGGEGELQVGTMTGTTPVWVMPKEVLEVQRVHTISALYNFELSPGASSVVINGVGVITLGQEIGFESTSDALYGWGWKFNPERERYVPKIITNSLLLAGPAFELLAV